MKSLLVHWEEYGWLRQVDTTFANFLWREAPDAHPLLILAAALTSHQLGRGHVCLDLAATLANPASVLSIPPGDIFTQEEKEAPTLPQEILAGLTLDQWKQALDYPELIGAGPGNTPLVRIGSRLYPRRYWRYEQEIRANLEQRFKMSQTLQQSLAIPKLREILDILFPSSLVTPNWQKIACALAVCNIFSVITGGPGTGKTTTVVSLLILLQALALFDKSRSETHPLRIRLAAPTGKAAARLNKSITETISDPEFICGMPADLVRASVPTRVTTIHGLLGSQVDSRHFRHHAGNPLALDVLIIDEASMVDLEMMAALFNALPASARIILLGDKDQLASVEAGGVLGELCLNANHGHYTTATFNWLRETTGEKIDVALIDQNGTALDQSVVMLRHSYRFSAGIGDLARAVNDGDSVVASQIWERNHQNLALLALTDTQNPLFRNLIINGIDKNHRGGGQGYRHYLEVLKNRPDPEAGQSAFDAWARVVLQAYDQFQVLCALRRGPWGTEGLNQKIAQLLHNAGLISATTGWYLGRPVMVTRNDYGLGLMNGDIGITLVLPDNANQNWTQRVAFPANDSGQNIKWILPSRLQAVETVHALTVHKSQGSEFRHVVFILPDTINPVLTRELLYTGITRARDFLTLINPGGKEFLDRIIQRRVLRAGGLWADE
ncbi:RecBCD enzyme subunit RecD [Gammaproteobacteria bacterium]